VRVVSFRAVVLVVPVVPVDPSVKGSLLPPPLSTVAILSGDSNEETPEKPG